jgi:hypothetical protein
MPSPFFGFRQGFRTGPYPYKLAFIEKQQVSPDRGKPIRNLDHS